MQLNHVMNRGVEGRHIFLDSQDYARFVHNLYEFNDTAPAGNTYRSFADASMLDLRGPTLKRRKREQLVDVHGWCLMKDHYHLLVSERLEGGLSHFLMKLNVGFAKYFNERYERSGTLFAGRTKKVPVERDTHFLYVLQYIHFNPLDYLEGAGGWRERHKKRIRNAARAREYLAKYRWSSYLDYSGQPNFPSLLTKSLFENNSAIYRKDSNDYLSTLEMENSEKLTFQCSTS